MNDLILIALKEEAPHLATYPNVFQTGVGKVNASITAARLIERHKPLRIWNFGSAGGITVSSGIHHCTRFIQRDMIVTPLGFLPGQTPFEDQLHIDAFLPNAASSTGLTCSSGDSFVISQDLQIPADLVDMEAYAIAKACLHASIPFHCYKFISDQANDSSHNDWRSNLHLGESAYIEILTQHNALG